MFSFGKSIPSYRSCQFGILTEKCILSIIYTWYTYIYTFISGSRIFNICSEHRWKKTAVELLSSLFQHNNLQPFSNLDPSINSNMKKSSLYVGVYIKLSETSWASKEGGTRQSASNSPSWPSIAILRSASQSSKREKRACTRYNVGPFT